MSSATKRTIDEAGWALFADDANTATSEIEEGLLVLERNPEDGEQINALFRALHTLKGSSGFVGLKALGELAHEAENLVGRVRGRELELTTAMVDVLLRVLDMLRRIVDESGDGPLAEHDGTIAPLCAELRGLSGVDKHTKPTLERLLKDSEELGAKLEACRSACDEGDDGIPTRELERLALKIHASGTALGLPACAEHSASFLEALHAGQIRSLRLRWYVLHDKVQGADNGDLVFFDVEDYDDPSGDDEAVRVFLDCVAALLSPLVHELGRTPAGSSELGAVLTELTELCVVMGCPNLAEPLTGLGEMAGKLDGQPSQAETAVKRFAAEVAGLERDWASRTGSAMGEGEDLAARSKRLWKGETHPYRKLAANAESGRRGVAAQQVVETATPVRRKAANQGRGSKFLRVEAEKVEQLMALAGEIGLAVGAVFNHSDVEALEHEDLRSNIGRVEGLIRELQDASAGFALVPVSSVFNRMNRLARDLIRQTGKKFELVIRGGETEIDKLWVDALLDPLIHLVRNAADHGIESAQERIAAGKPEVARIVLSAQHQGGNVAIKLQDDGGGMNREAILGRAVERGIVSEEAAETISDSDVWDLVFAPGFSTTQTVSNISGRGMGMDVVRAAVEAHRGHVSIESREGQGTSVTLQVPLTLAFLDGMVVRVGSWLYVLPVVAVTRVFRVTEAELVRVKSGSVDLVRVGEDLVPCLELEAFFSETEPEDLLGRLVVVVHAARGRMAIPIDELVGQEQVTMNPLSGFLAHIRGAAACGLLRSGEVAIALDCERLYAQAL